MTVGAKAEGTEESASAKPTEQPNTIVKEETPKPGVKTSAVVEGGTNEKPKADAGAGNTASKAHKLNEDDEIPEAAELLEMSPKAFKSRLARHTKKELREKFGTEDLGEIKAKLAKLDEFETREEESRRAALDEKTRLEEDLAKANARAEQAEFHVQQVRENQMVDKEENRILTLANKHMDGEYIEDHLPKLARHLKKTYTEKQLRRLPDSAIEKWFAEQVEAKPKFGKDYESKQEAAAKKQAKEDSKANEKPKTRVALTSGSKSNEKPAANGSGGEGSSKTFKPGQANSMSSAEARANAKKMGLQW